MQGWAVTGRRGLTAALVTVLVLAACSESDEAPGDAGGARPRDDRGGRAAAEGVTSARPLLSALSDEAAVTGLGILGLQDAIEMPVGDRTEARRRTDAALADLDTAATGSAEGGAGPYRATLEALGGLAALRSDVDGHAAPASLNELPFAAEVQVRYDALADVLLDDLAGAAEAVPEDVRVGSELYVEGLRQITLVPRLRFALYRGFGQAADAAWVTETAALASDLQRGRARVVELAAGTPYEETATRLAAELDAAGFGAPVADALSTGQYDVAAVLQSLRLEPGQGWIAFVDRVEEMLLA